MAKKTKKSNKKSVKEVFEVEDKKTGESKQIVKNSKEPSEHSDKKEIKRNEKQLKVILIVLGALIVFFFIVFFGLNGIRNAKYENTEFQTVQEGQLIFYQTSIPVIYQGAVVPYNFYLRTHPRDLKKIPFEGTLELKKGYALNVTQDFNCYGDGVIALANLVKQRDVMGVTTISGEVGCDAQSRYNYYEIIEGDETKIVQRGDTSCYDLYVSDCEILPVTEKLMAETFVKFNE